MKYHFTLDDYFLKIKENNKDWRDCGEVRTLLHSSWEYNVVQLLWKRVWQFLKKLIM